MKTVKIDLGSEGPCCAPVTSSEDRKYYPTIHIDGDEEIKFPHDGKMTVVFHKTASSVSERDGKKHYSCTLEVREVVAMEAEKEDSESTPRKSEKALDALMAEYQKSKKNKESY